MKDLFTPFNMPDFCSRPDGKSKLLKDAYIYLRRRGFPDKDIFIYAQGEFNKFRGDVIEQEPPKGEMISPGDRITIVAAVSGICQIMPDLFTDHISGLQTENENPRQGTKNLFAIFDSAILKMLCRLEWIRDIYSGVHHSSGFIDYLNSVFFISDREVNKPGFKSLGFLLSRLSRFEGTDGALRVFLESTTGLKINTGILGNQKKSIPNDAVTRMGERHRLGEDAFLGRIFESEKPELEVSFTLDRSEDVKKAINLSGDQDARDDIVRFILPYFMEGYKFSIDPASDGIEFVNGNSYLGFSTSLNSYDRERS